LIMSIFRFFFFPTWSIILERLNLFGERTAFLSFWFIPALVYYMNVVPVLSGVAIFLPFEPIAVFTSAIAFLSSKLIYRIACPASHKGVASKIDFVKNRTERQKILKDALDNEVALHESAANYIEKTSGNRIASSGIFPDNSGSVVIIELKKHFSDRHVNTTSLLTAMEAISSLNFESLEENSPELRFICNLLLIFSLGIIIQQLITKIRLVGEFKTIL